MVGAVDKGQEEKELGSDWSGGMDCDVGGNQGASTL